jgi:hypothetical protein
LSFWAANAPRGVSGWRILAIAVAIGSFGVLVLVLLGQRLSRGRAAATTAVGLFVFVNWRIISEVFSEIPFLELIPEVVVAAALTAVLIAGAWCMGDRREFQFIALFMAVALALAPLPSLAGWYFGDAGESPVRAGSVQQLPPSPHNVYFIIVDGYARRDVLQSQFGYDLDTSDFEQHGLEVLNDARSGYSSTVASIASMLTMSKVGVEGERPTDRDRAWLHQIMGGDNPVVQSFTAAGYEYVHIESGWDGTRCGPAVDRCFSSGLVDEAFGALLENSAAAWFFKSRFGSAFTVNGLRALDDLQAVAGLSTDRPLFVFAHIPLPHPPMFLDGTCTLRYDADLGGPALGNQRLAGTALLEYRRAGYLRQIECVNHRLGEFLDAVPHDDLVIITADHGSDAAGQLSLQPNDWNADAVRERIGVFTAVRLPGCGAIEEVPVVLPDLFRLAFACLTGVRPTGAHPEMYVYPVDSSPGVVTQLDYK